MKKRFITMLLLGLTNPVMADDSVNHSGQASKHSALATIESAGTTVSVASAVAATPVILSVAAGAAVVSAADNIHASSERKRRDPIEITHKIITVDPAPNVAVTKPSTDKENR